MLKYNIGILLPFEETENNQIDVKPHAQQDKWDNDYVVHENHHKNQELILKQDA